MTVKPLTNIARTLARETGANERWVPVKVACSPRSPLRNLRQLRQDLLNMAHEPRRWQWMFVLTLGACSDAGAEDKFDRLFEIYEKNQQLMCKCVGDCDDDQPGPAARECYIDLISRESSIGSYFDCWSDVYAKDNSCLSDANRCAAEQVSGGCGTMMNEQRKKCEQLSDEEEEKLDECENLDDTE